jgi:hypothetical protein
VGGACVEGVGEAQKDMFLARIGGIRALQG